MSDVFFEGVPQEPIRFGGFEARAPLFFRDMGMLAAVFTADLEAARALVPGEGRYPLIFTPGRTFVAIHAMEYRDSDVGAYNEISISVGIAFTRNPVLRTCSAVRATLRRDYHAHVTHLPVTTDAALAGGIEVFGYPKVLADIEFRDDEPKRSVVWRDRETGAPVLTLSGPRPSMRIVPQERREALSLMDLHSYPVKDGHTLHAHLRVNRIEYAEPLVPPLVIATLGDAHPAGVLAGLKLGRCMQYLYAPRCQGILFRPEPVEEASQ